jgi:hypothetical protein
VWLVSSLACYALLVPCHGSVVGPSSPLLGAGGSSVRNSAAWLVSSLLCYSLLALCHGSVLGPSTVVLVWGIQFCRWFLHCCVTRCSCYVTAAWLGPAPPIMGAGGSSVGNSAMWLVPSLLCYSLLALCHHGSVVGPSSTPFHGRWWF